MDRLWIEVGVEKLGRVAGALVKASQGFEVRIDPVDVRRVFVGVDNPGAEQVVRRSRV